MEPELGFIGLLVFSKDFVVDDVVMSGSSGAFQGSMGLQEEIPISGFRDTPVNDGAISTVVILIGISTFVG